MRMWKEAVLAGVLATILWSCSNEKQTPRGFKFTVLKKGDGKELVPGQFLILDMLVKDAKDSVWADTRKDGFPVTSQIQVPPVDRETARQEGLDAVFRMMTKGDSITFKVTAKLFFATVWRERVPPNVDSTSYFTFFLTAKNVMNEAAFRQYQQTLIKLQNEQKEKQRVAQLSKDTVLIDAFLAEKGIVANKTSSGLRYEMLKAGRGKTIRNGQFVEVNYKGYLLDGTVFDTNIESAAREAGLHRDGVQYSPYSLQLGTSPEVRGWHEILKLMSLGSRVIVYVPSSLGYGPNRAGKIKENSILVFDMEVVKIK